LEKSATPVYDKNGRGSHYFLKIGPHKLPIYQPGTVAYNSAMMKSTHLAIQQNTQSGEKEQKNGPVLDVQDCLFLATFMTDMVANYNHMASTQGYSTKNFIPHLYSDALLTTLSKLAREDAASNGIINELKLLLTTFDPSIMELSEQENCLFHLNEFRLYEILTKKKPTMKEVKYFRKKNQFWYHWKDLFNDFADSSVFAGHLDTLKAALLKTAYLFEEGTHYYELDQFFCQLNAKAESVLGKKVFFDEKSDSHTRQRHSQRMSSLGNSKASGGNDSMKGGVTSDMFDLDN